MVDEKAKTSYLNTAFSDAIAIYILSLFLDVDYYDLREREYPLLAPKALAERLRKTGVEQQLVSVPGGGHGINNIDSGEQDRIYRDAAAFLMKRA